LLLKPAPRIHADWKDGLHTGGHRTGTEGGSQCQARKRELLDLAIPAGRKDDQRLLTKKGRESCMTPRQLAAGIIGLDEPSGRLPPVGSKAPSARLAEKLV
jgi:hypothetical protein